MPWNTLCLLHVINDQAGFTAGGAAALNGAEVIFPPFIGSQIGIQAIRQVLFNVLLSLPSTWQLSLEAENTDMPGNSQTIEIELAY